MNSNTLATGKKEIKIITEKSRKKSKNGIRNISLFTMLIPGAVLIFILNYLPMFGIIIAFKKINMRDGILKSPWIGLENFKFMFRSEDAWLITRNTVGYNLIFIVFGLIIAVALAIALNEVRNKTLSKIYQTIMLMPHFLSFVVVSYLVLAFLNVENGYLNKHILPLLGMEPVSWYTNPKPWPWILIIVHFWKVAGYSSIVYLAAIVGIDTELYEAAEIDGANKWNQIVYITIPSLKQLMTIMTILNFGKIFNADFGLFYQVPLDSGALYSATYVINTYVYNMLTSAGTSSLGMASAAALYQSFVGFILVIICNTIVRKIDSSNSLF